MPVIRANVVSRFLTTNGFSRSVTSSTRIRGWQTWTTGFEATGLPDGTVRIVWTMGSRSHRDGDITEAVKQQEAMRALLETRYTVELDADEYSQTQFLLVGPKQ